MKTIYSQGYLQNSTPSRKDGVDAAKEQQLRSTYFLFIRRLVQELKLPSWSVETATVFAHRFFAARSISKNDRFLVAAASVFLSCKVDECPRGLRDVAYVFIKLKSANKPAELEKLRTNTDAATIPVMENILLAERALLYTLAFDLSVDHPYSHVVNALKKLRLTEVLTSQDTADPQVKDFFQATVNMLNDSLKTTLCLQYDASKLAAAIMYHVARLAKYTIPLPQGVAYHELFGVSQAEVEDIARQMMQLYDKKAQAAPAQPVPQLSDLLPSARPNGPPLPTFRPVILTDSPAQSQQQQQVLQSSVPSEEGELATSGKHAVMGPKAAEPAPSDAAGSCGASHIVEASTHTSAPAPSVIEPSDLDRGHQAAPSPGLVDSDGEHEVRHAPGSGDQNNHNEPEVPEVSASEQAQQPAASRKRTRSPGLEDGELGCLQQTAKRSPGRPCA